MTDYCFVTTWVIDAPIERVWEEIIHSERWTNWWKYVESVVDTEPSEDSGTEKIQRITWTTPLFYKLVFDTQLTRIEPPNLLALVAKGDVDGVGLWELESVEQGTLVRYTWKVKTTKVWMNILAVFIKPLMEWNHNTIMQQGGEALAQLLDTRLIASEAGNIKPDID
ncbi:Polyketide cyclase / dehydrase and lipid transport [Cylindrospermum stagnale PCC 7417]|uniref:Polyketide cyclase / dehydrase and lipid transport n=1 Tax=Cylindrospermum stagnale PCC 7417 TaxID=56107 RepID=K9X417_9NOST|nr:SRPBCC family protein [Cylindrospermum stagnale]AFZ27193.1 Polyketide cyclase / dehydrase and lipid transport [Cylindrospermum stagnale PCC 7417]